MSERRRLNTEHPDYEKYCNECSDLQRRMEESYNSTKYDGGLDGGWADVSSKFNAEFKKIKEKYSYLYVEE